MIHDRSPKCHWRQCGSLAGVYSRSHAVQSAWYRDEKNDLATSWLVLFSFSREKPRRHRRGYLVIVSRFPERASSPSRTLCWMLDLDVFSECEKRRRPPTTRSEYICDELSTCDDKCVAFRDDVVFGVAYWVPRRVFRRKEKKQIWESTDELFSCNEVIVVAT